MPVHPAPHPVRPGEVSTSAGGDTDGADGAQPATQPPRGLLRRLADAAAAAHRDGVPF